MRHCISVPVKEATAIGILDDDEVKEGIFAAHPPLALPPLALTSHALSLASLAFA